MALFWIKAEVDGEPVFHLREDTAQVFAMMRWGIAHPDRPHLESGEVDPAVVHRVPKRMIGRDLTQAEMQDLLARLDRPVRSRARSPRRRDKA